MQEEKDAADMVGRSEVWWVTCAHFVSLCYFAKSNTFAQCDPVPLDLTGQIVSS